MVLEFASPANVSNATNVRTAARIVIILCIGLMTSLFFKTLK